MTEDGKRTTIQRYFSPAPRWPWATIALGALTAPAAGWSIAGVLLGLLLAGAGAAELLVHRAGALGDHEHDRVRAEALERLERVRAVQLWEVERDGGLVADSVVVYGPAVGCGGAVPAARRGRDGVIRFSAVRFAVLGFGEHQLLAYQGVLDLATGRLHSEVAAEVAYRDVASVATRTVAMEVEWEGEPRRLDDVEAFVLATPDGAEVSVPLRSPALAGLLGGGELLAGGADRAVASVRSMLRQKRARRGARA